MKQTAVEWLAEKLRVEFGFAFSNNILEQAKEMEKQEKDEFAIGFAEWLVTDWHNDERWSIITERKELLEIYKKEKGL